MVTKKQLVNRIAATADKTGPLQLKHLLPETQTSLKDLIELTAYPDKKIANSAAWLMENTFLNAPERHIRQLPFFLSKMREIDTQPCKRHYAKVLMQLTSPKASEIVKSKLSKLDVEDAAATCFDWFTDPDSMDVIKSFTAEALFNMRHRFPGIIEGLLPELSRLARKGSPLLQSKCGRLLEFLNPSQK